MNRCATELAPISVYQCSDFVSWFRSFAIQKESHAKPQSRNEEI
jgi:hypothetical protein